MPALKKITTASIKSKFSEIDVYTQSLKIKDVVHLFYVAVRNVDKEEGAVQRVLNKQRIHSIKKYILEGNDFFSTFILNWTDKSIEPLFDNGKIIIPIVPKGAQVIDGQHRLVGIKEAMEDDPEIGEKEILVSLCINLTTKEAAKIFTNINAEQKPVPKSLIYDLFGEIEIDPQHAINRANDIADDLNSYGESAYYSCIKYPGQPKGAGFVDLSTVVSSLKKHLDIDGIFYSIKITSLDNQKLVVMNYFNAIKYFYDKEDIWTNRAKNPFLTNAGFHGAIEHLVKNLLIKCAERRSFKFEDFKNLLNLRSESLLTRTELKSLEGKSQRKAILDFLEENFMRDIADNGNYEF